MVVLVLVAGQRRRSIVRAVQLLLVVVLLLLLRQFRLGKHLHRQFLLFVELQFSGWERGKKKEIDFESEHMDKDCMLLTYCSIQSGFSVVFKSSIICFLIKASFLLVSFGIVMTLCREEKEKD